VMATVGEGIFKLSPVAAFVVVSAHSVVLFLFASQGLQNLLIQLGLPPIPLVPVSSSQAIVGAVVGIGLLKGGRGIRWRTLGGIASSWAVSPIIASILSFISLFFLQNVFEQEVYRPIKYELTPNAIEQIQTAKISVRDLNTCSSKNLLMRVDSTRRFRIRGCLPIRIAISSWLQPKYHCRKCGIFVYSDFPNMFV